MDWFGLMVESRSRKRAPSIVSGSRVHEGGGIWGRSPANHGSEEQSGVGLLSSILPGSCGHQDGTLCSGLGVGRTERPACPSGSLLCPHCPVLALVLGCDGHTWTRLVWELQAQLGQPPHSGVPGDRQAGRQGGGLTAKSPVAGTCLPEVTGAEMNVGSREQLRALGVPSSGTQIIQ